MRFGIRVHLWPLVGLLLAGCAGDDTVIPGALEYVSAAPQYIPKTEKRLRVAAVALRVSRDKEANLAQMERTIAEVKRADPGVRLLHFGEATLGWYYDPEKPETYQASIAEEIPGAATVRMAATAKAHGVYVSWGMIERRDERLYGAGVLLSPDGRVLAVHRKMLLFPLDEASGIAPAAPNAQTAAVDGVTVGLMVCFDGKSEWLQSELRQRGAELVLWSVASQLPVSGVLPAARKAGAWVAVGNRIGREEDERYAGEIAIADPLGAVRVSSTGREGYVVFDVEP